MSSFFGIPQSEMGLTKDVSCSPSDSENSN